MSEINMINRGFEAMIPKSKNKEEKTEFSNRIKFKFLGKVVYLSLVVTSMED